MKKKCLMPICERPAASRGLCDGCYTEAWKYVKAGKDTWEGLVRLGKALPKQKAGRKVQSWFAGSIHSD